MPAGLMSLDHQHHQNAKNLERFLKRFCIFNLEPISSSDRAAPGGAGAGPAAPGVSVRYQC